jgi:cell shape-determining protein MreC
MTYLSGRSRSRKKYVYMILGFVALIIFVYFWPSIRSFVYPIIEPLARGYKSVKTTSSVLPSSLSTYFSSRSMLGKRNADLENSIERLENQLAQKDALLREQGVMREAGSSTSPVIVMYPIAEDITKLYSTILLSRGYKDGLVKGGLAYIRGMQPVCEIVEVYTTTSLCELLSKGERVTEGVTQGGVTLTLLGQGGGNFTADLPKATDLLVGEEVYLRSNPSFKLGTVVSVKEDEQGGIEKAYVRGSYNPVTSQVFYMDSKYAP